jgi:hypothetical protein
MPCINVAVGGKGVTPVISGTAPEIVANELELKKVATDQQHPLQRCLSAGCVANHNGMLTTD